MDLCYGDNKLISKVHLDSVADPWPFALHLFSQLGPGSSRSTIITSLILLRVFSCFGTRDFAKFIFCFAFFFFLEISFNDVISFNIVDEMKNSLQVQKKKQRKMHKGIAEKENKAPKSI